VLGQKCRTALKAGSAMTLPVFFTGSHDLQTLYAVMFMRSNSLAPDTLFTLSQNCIIQVIGLTKLKLSFQEPLKTKPEI
jgi:hypothetical protein